MVNVEGKQMEYAKTFLLLAFIFIVLMMLNKFGLLKFGKTSDEKDVDRLNNIPNFKPEYESVLYAAIKKKLKVAKPTRSQIESFLPTKTELNTWVKNLWDAKAFWNDDESKTYGVFRSMNTQMDVWAFAKIFQAVKDKDLFGFLESYLNPAEISMVYNIIKEKPLV